MKFKKLDRHYVSPYDRFLDDLRQKQPETASQKRERKKAEALALKRDNPDYKDNTNIIWTDF